MEGQQISGRNNAISYVRLVAMVMVILCHFLQFYGNELAFWFNVGVEVFLVISGFLYGSKEIDDPVGFICRRFKKILIPYYAYLLPISLLYLLFAGENFLPESMIKAVFCVGTLDGLGHLWFIGYILFCYLLTPYLYWLRKKAEEYSVLKMSAIYIAVLLGLVIVGTLADFYFQPPRICCYVVGFMLSSYRNKYGIFALKVAGGISVGLAIILNAWRVYIKYYYALPTGSLLHKLFSFAEPYLHLLLGVALFLCLYFAFSKVCASPLARWADRYSFPVYIVHQTFILSPFSTMDLSSSAPINWVITIALILVCGVALHYITGYNFKKFVLRR